MLFFKKIERLDHRTVCVTVEINALDWKKAHKGALYGIDIGNAVYRSTGINTHNPCVDDTARAVDGFKTIKLFYNDAEWCPVNNVLEFKRRAA